MKTRKLKFQVGRSKKDRLFYWRIRAKNGEIIAQGEGYKTRHSTLKVYRLLKDGFDHDEIDVQELDASGKPIPEPKYAGTLVTARGD